MAEERVKDMMGWLSKIETDESTILPESIQQSKNLLIEIEETIEVIHTKRPMLNAAADNSYQVIEKYDAVRKINVDDDKHDIHIKKLKKRISTLEEETENLKLKIEKIAEIYLNLRKALIDHLQSLKDNSDTAEVQNQMERLREMLDLICSDMLMDLPLTADIAHHQVEAIQGLTEEVITQKDNIIKSTSLTRSKLQNTNIPEDQVKSLHLAASNLEDKLHGTSYQLSERDKIHSNLLNILRDFEKVGQVNYDFPIKTILARRNFDDFSQLGQGRSRWALSS